MKSLKPWSSLPLLDPPQPEGIQFGHSTSTQCNSKGPPFPCWNHPRLTALHHPSCSRFEMNLQPGDTLPWKFPADVARRVFSPTKNSSSPPQKKNGNIIHKQQKNYQKLVFGVNKPFPTRTNVHSQFSRLFRNTNGWSCRTWLWIGRCCSPTRLDVEAKNFSKI